MSCGAGYINKKLNAALIVCMLIFAVRNYLTALNKDLKEIAMELILKTPAQPRKFCYGDEEECPHDSCYASFW